jgi:hypothetical protein
MEINIFEVKTDNNNYSSKDEYGLRKISMSGIDYECEISLNKYNTLDNSPLTPNSNKKLKIQ